MEASDNEHINDTSELLNKLNKLKKDKNCTI